MATILINSAKGGKYKLKLSTSDITKMGLFVAISVILSRFLSFKVIFMGIEGIRIGFGSLTIVLSGIIFGPVGGVVVGTLSDIIGYMISPLGPYMPHFTLNAALVGLIPALFLNRTYLKHHDLPLFALIIGIGIEELITTVILLPYFLNTLFGIPLKAILPAYIVRAILDTIIFAMVIKALLQKRVL